MSQIVCSTVLFDLTGVDGIDQMICLTDAPFDVVKDGVTYRSFGSLLKIDKVTTENTITAKTLSVTLSGIDKQVMGTINSTAFRERPVVISRCTVQEGSNVVGTDETYFRGTGGTPEVTVDYSNGYVSLTVQCKSIFDLSKKAEFSRSNHATHSFWFDGDMFFQYAASTALEDKVWKI